MSKAGYVFRDDLGMYAVVGAQEGFSQKKTLEWSNRLDDATVLRVPSLRLKFRATCDRHLLSGVQVYAIQVRTSVQIVDPADEL